MLISKTFTFEASHVLPKHPGKCSRLHGHSWKLIIKVAGPINPETGFVVDYGVLSELVKRHVVDPLDHSHLGQGGAECFLVERTSVKGGIFFQPYFGPDFYPSSENLCKAIGLILQPLIKELSNSHARLYEVVLSETCTSEAHWRPRDGVEPYEASE